MNVSVSLVVVSHDQRLVLLQPQRLQALVDGPGHLLATGLLVLGPVQRVVADRLRQLPAGRRAPGQALEVRGRLRGGRHHRGRPISPARRQVPGVGPLHPVEGLGLGIPLQPRVVQAVRCDAGERAAEAGHLGDHQSSPATRASTSSPTRSTASRVPAGTTAAPVFRARAT